jgi:hypothetical protein
MKVEDQRFWEEHAHGRNLLHINQAEKPAFLNKTKDSLLFLGHERTARGKDGKEIWLTKSMIKRHMLIMGSTGSGKTEVLLGLMANSMSWNSGGVLIDGKGDIATAVRMTGLADKFGRRDDFYTLNFMSKADSNTFNPFATMSSDAITQMLISTMDDVGGDGAMWRGRATAMFTGIVRALVWMRDHKNLYLDVSVIRDNIGLKQVIDLADPNLHQDMPIPVRKTLTSYLSSLPGYQAEKHYRQSQTTCDQHGYLQMQWARTLGSMADVYGHIFCAGSSDIDMEDIIKNRRVLLVLLPALEKSSDELANLGKFITASIRQMLGSTLGAEISGTWEDAVKHRNKREAPFLCIFDEVGFYLTDGMDLIAAQGRSLNVGLVFAAQDIDAMFRHNPKVAQSIMGNVGTKILMRSESPKTPLLSFLDVFNTQGNLEAPVRPFDVVGHAKRIYWAHRNRLASSVPIADRLRYQSAGEFLAVQGASAAFGSALYVSCPPIGREIKLTRYHDTVEAASTLVAAIKGVAAAKADHGLPFLPDAFAPLTKIMETEPLPGGEAYLAAALETLSMIGAVDQKPVSVERIKLGE